jgi:hypothetical protein
MRSSVLLRRGTLFLSVNQYFKSCFRIVEMSRHWTLTMLLRCVSLRPTPLDRWPQHQSRYLAEGNVETGAHAGMLQRNAAAYVRGKRFQ